MDPEGMLSVLLQCYGSQTNVMVRDDFFKRYKPQRKYNPTCRMSSHFLDEPLMIPALGGEIPYFGVPNPSQQEHQFTSCLILYCQHNFMDL